MLRRTVVMLSFILLLLCPQAALGQAGPYELVIEGEVRRSGGAAATMNPVILTTPLGETLTGKTDMTGRFVITGTVTADAGVLEVRTPGETTSFGQMNVTWAAGGPGLKNLVINLTTDGHDLRAEGSEPPYPAPLPGETAAEPVTPTPVALATAAPDVAPAEEENLTSTPGVEAEIQPESSGGWWVGLMLILVGLLAGGGIIIGGILLKRNLPA